MHKSHLSRNEIFPSQWSPECVKLHWLTIQVVKRFLPNYAATYSYKAERA